MESISHEKPKRQPDPFGFEPAPAFPDDDQASLAKAFDFSAHDLHCNQDGILSKAQRDRLERQMRRDALEWFGLAAILAVFEIIIVLAAVRDTPSLFSLDGAMMIFSLSAFGALLVTVAFSGYQRRMRFAHDLDAGDVLTSAGPIAIKIARRGRSGPTHGLLTIGYETFRIPEQAVLQLRVGDALRIYTTPESRVVLSAERSL